MDRLYSNPHEDNTGDGVTWLWMNIKRLMWFLHAQMKEDEDGWCKARVAATSQISLVYVIW